VNLFQATKTAQVCSALQKHLYWEMIISCWPTTMIGPCEQSSTVSHFIQSIFSSSMGAGWGETKQFTLDVLNIHRGLPLGHALNAEIFTPYL